jgi:uncharacterized protein YlxW (UPF0749 family)
MTLVLGVFIALALRTQERIVKLYPSSVPNFEQSSLIYAVTIQKMQTMIFQQQQEIGELTKGRGESGPRLETMKTELEDARVLAGLTAVAGPGVIVTLQDSAKKPPAGISPAAKTQFETDATVHDQDIIRVINELRAAGAEAFAVNDQRVVVTTAIRCVGPAIQVNGVPLTPPYNVRAIGDSDTLYTALKLQGGINDNLQAFDPAMIAISKSSSLTVPEFTGATALKSGHPVLSYDGQKVSNAAIGAAG